MVRSHFKKRLRIYESFTNLSGGNMVGGLPPAFNFGPRRNFSILILRSFWIGKFIVAIIIFRTQGTYVIILM